MAGVSLRKYHITCRIQCTVSNFACSHLPLPVSVQDMVSRFESTARCAPYSSTSPFLVLDCAILAGFSSPESCFLTPEVGRSLGLA